MTTFIVQRLLSLIPLVLAVALFSFVLIDAAPGDFLTELSLNPHVSPETIASLRTKYGLDRPWYIQYFKWVRGMATGDFGYSFSYNRPVLDLIGERVINTSLLALISLLFALTISIPFGVIAALYRYKWIDKVLCSFSFLILSFPSLFLSLLAMLFAASSGWFPIGGTRSLGYENLSSIRKLTDFLHHAFLPALVLSLRISAIYVRQVRVTLLDVLSQDYIRTARAKGLPKRMVIFKHGLRNALNPLISMFGNSLASLLSGAFVVEVVISWPGIGSLTLTALLSRDPYLLMACLTYASILLLGGNLLADLLLAFTDPRVRFVRANP